MMTYYLALFFFPLLAILLGILMVGVYKEFQRKRLETDRIPTAIQDIDSLFFEISRRKDDTYYRRFLDSYFKLLVQYVNKAEKSITILDYLAHHRALNIIHDENLIENYKKYFSVIEENVKSKGLQYTRILQLPLRLNSEMNREKLIKKAVNYTFSETLEHVMRLYGISKNFRLYVLGAALRPYSIVVVDDSCLIAEYDRYNLRGLSLPDHIIINIAKPSNYLNNIHVQNLIKNHNEKIWQVLEHQRYVTGEEIENAIQELGSEKILPYKVTLSVDKSGLESLIQEKSKYGADISFLQLNTEEINTIKKGVAKKMKIGRSSD